VSQLRTARTRTRHATQPSAASEDLRFGDSRYIVATRRRCQRAAPHRTNDVDTDQRRRTLDGLPNPDPLTRSAIEGSHERESRQRNADRSPIVLRSPGLGSDESAHRSGTEMVGTTGHQRTTRPRLAGDRRRGDPGCHVGASRVLSDVRGGTLDGGVPGPEVSHEGSEFGGTFERGEGA